MIQLFYFIALIVLIIASYTDFRKREVPDWLNYGLIFAGVGISGIASIVFYDYHYILYSLTGLALGIAIALGMFYAGQWGGGDSKLLMGLGALIGLTFSINAFYVSFLVNIFMVGAVYGFVWSIVLVFRNWKNFTVAFKKLWNERKNRIARFSLTALLLILIVLSIAVKELAIALIGTGLLVILGYFLFIIAKTVEACCMFKWISASKLVEGDWIAEAVYVGKKKIVGVKRLGLDAKDVELLHKLKNKKVLVKEGIPFVPAFLLAFIFTYFWGNILLMFI